MTFDESENYQKTTFTVIIFIKAHFLFHFKTEWKHAPKKIVPGKDTLQLEITYLKKYTETNFTDFSPN